MFTDVTGQYSQYLKKHTKTSIIELYAVRLVAMQQ